MVRAGDQVLLNAVASRAAAALLVARSRIYLRSWRSAAMESIAARAAAEFCAQRAQEACKADIASRFHQLWALHLSFHTWRTFAHNARCAAAAAAAAAQAAEAEAAALAQRGRETRKQIVQGNDHQDTHQQKEIK